MYREWKERFIRIFKKEFPDAPNLVLKRLLSTATSCQRYNEKCCSVPMGEVEALKEEEKNRKRIQKAALMVRTRLGVSLIENGDPRGYPFYLTTKVNYDFGGGLGVPGRGYSCAELDRLILQAEHYQRKLREGV